MPLGSVVQKGLPIFLGFITLFSLIEMIIAAVLVSSYNSNDDYPSGLFRGATRFLLFISLWTLITAPAFIVVILYAASSIIASIASHGIWTALTWLFWLAGAAAITDANGNRRCGNSTLAHCYQLQALEGFAWINWILFTLFLGFLVFLGVRSQRNGNGFTGPMLA